MCEFVGKALGIVCGVKMARFLSPFAKPTDHATDQLPDTVLAPGCADVSAEVLGDDDVRSELGSFFRDFDVRLFEYDFALLVGDLRMSGIPLD